MLVQTAIVVLSTSILCFHFYKHWQSGSLPWDFLVKTSNDLNDTELRPPNPTVPQPPSYSKLHVFEEAAICSDSEQCSQIGRVMLLHGGSAVDAAIATLLCNGLITMQSMGLGGGMLMNIYSRNDKRAYSVLSREVAPLTLKSQRLAYFHNASELAQSSLAIAVPAEVLGYAVAHERFGKLTWSQLLGPTLLICHNGFLLTKHQYDALHTNGAMTSKDPLLRKMFVDFSTNKFHRAGTHVKPPTELCQTYELLATYGPRYFYDGKLADNIVKDLKDMGSAIRASDLSSLNVEIVESLVLPLDAYNLHLMPPPSSGYIIGFIMRLLQKSFKFRKGMHSTAMHNFVEALKFAFVKRWELDMNVDKSFLNNLTCPIYAEKLAASINNEFTHDDPTYYGADRKLLTRAEHGTAHISVLAPNGDAVAVTSSINFYFGSGRMGSRTGILFNNAMSDFNIQSLHNYFDLPFLKGKNQVRPGQSPMSSMSPIIVTDASGDVNLVIGAAGGTKMISALSQILIRTLWLGQTIKEAIDAARIHHQLLPNVLEYEYGILENSIRALEWRGHHTKRYRVRGSVVCGIQRGKNGTIFANADYRKEGGVAGY